MEHGSGTIGTDGDPAEVSDRASKCAIVRWVVTESSEAYELSNVVETALAKALVLAAQAKRWDVVLQIAAELQSCRGDGALSRRPSHHQSGSSARRTCEGGAPRRAALIPR